MHPEERKTVVGTYGHKSWER